MRNPNTIGQRTWLCPDCDGYGVTMYRCGHNHNDPSCDCERPCPGECGGTGVIAASDGEGLQPWTGEVGRNACRRRIQRTDPLVTMAGLRPRAAEAVRQGRKIDFTEYGRIRQKFALPYRANFARLDMLRAAILCDVAQREAVAAFRKVA